LRDAALTSGALLKNCPLLPSTAKMRGVIVVVPMVRAQQMMIEGVERGRVIE
jgi:hypothetical protein